MPETDAAPREQPGTGIFDFTCLCAASSLDSLEPAMREEAVACFERDGFIPADSPAFTVLYDKGVIHTDGYAIGPFHAVLTARGVNVKPLC